MNDNRLVFDALGGISLLVLLGAVGTLVAMLIR